MGIDISEFDFSRKGGSHLGTPGVTVNSQGVAAFNSDASRIIKKNGYRYCRTGIACGGMVVFVMSKQYEADCRKLSYLQTNQVRVRTGGRLITHAAVPVEIDGDYFIAKFD